MLEDPAFHALMAQLFVAGHGVYWFAELQRDDPDDAEDILEYVIETYPRSLGPEPEARRRISEFLAEVERTRAEFPEIEYRSAMLEKSGHDIYERLSAALKKIRPDGAQFADTLMAGDRKLLGPSGDPEVNALGLASTALVREGAAVLEPLDPEALFPGNDERETWCRNGYAAFRQTYLDAAEHGEEILIGRS